MIEGDFIVLEGIDGSGTTTQANRLAVRLRSMGLPIAVTHEPSNGPIGALIRQVLQGRMVVPGLSGGGRPPSWNTMALMFAADRLDHLESMVHPNLLEGVTVISDRYDYSSVAYQSVTADGDPSVVAWVRDINRHARRPDLTLVFDVDPAIAERRRAQRAGRRELFDDEELQRDLASFYRDMERHFPEDRIVHVDGDRSADEVADEVLEIVQDHRRTGHAQTASSG